jgi:hypothetical protein
MIQIKDCEPMRRVFFLLPLLAVACATPREACIGQASRELGVVNALIAETQANLSRGYGVETRQEIVTTEKTCTVTNPDGSVVRFPCDEVETRDRRVPVAIDLNVEQAKLRSLQQRQAQMRSQTNAAIGQCIATYPE